MMKEDVFKLLNVSIYEVFKLKNNVNEFPDLYYLDGELNLRIKDSTCKNDESYHSIKDILNDRFQIVKLPFIPSDGEEYWYYDFINKISIEKCFMGTMFDYYNLFIGNCFINDNNITKEFILELNEKVFNENTY